MPLIEPTIDERNFEQILDETLARIPVHNPEWTNFNDSDPGVTMLQLFAFMTESLMYRANRLPERNRLKFLRLLDIPIQAAAAAQGIVTFSNQRGPLAVRLLPPDLELSAGPVTFRTQDGLDVLPIEGQIYFKSKPNLTAEEEVETEAIYKQLYESLDEPGTTFAYYETKLYGAPVNGAALPTLNLKDTVDGRLWLALLARTPDEVEQARSVIANKVLTLAIVPTEAEAHKVLPAGGRLRDETRPSLVFARPNVARSDATTGAKYVPLQARPSGNLLREPGIVELLLPSADALKTWDEALDPLEAGTGEFPPSLDESEVAERLITWLRIQPGEDAGTVGGKVSANFSFIGINASRVSQRARVFSEFLGQGTGEPDHAVVLVNTPVIPETVTLTVNGEPWRLIDDLTAAGPEVARRSRRTLPSGPATSELPEESKVFTVDRESGIVRFGSGLHGARPPRGAIIQASYDYGGGLQGMVGIGAISKGPTLPAGLKATNPIPTWGGDEAETVAEAERRIPRYLRHRDRLVSEEDFRDITFRTPGVDIGRVEVLPLFDAEHPDVDAEGVVTLMVIPKYDAEQPEAPVPDRLFLEAVCGHLEPRRLITTELHVRGPNYVPIYVSVGIDVVPGSDIAPVRDAVKDTLHGFLSPLFGGFEAQGWPLERNVEMLELLAVAARVRGVSKVNRVRLAKGSDAETEAVPMTGLALPHLVGVAVQLGDAMSLDELRGEAVIEVEAGGQKTVPIPIVPHEC